MQNEKRNCNRLIKKDECAQGQPCGVVHAFGRGAGSSSLNKNDL